MNVIAWMHKAMLNCIRRKSVAFRIGFILGSILHILPKFETSIKKKIQDFIEMKYSNRIAVSFITSKLSKNGSIENFYVSGATYQLSANDREKGKRQSEFKKINTIFV